MSRLLQRIVDLRRGAATTHPASGRITSDIPALQPDYLKTILDNIDAQPEDRRLGTGGGDYGHYTHVSSLIGMCSRQHALAALDERTIRDTVTGGHRVMWAMGRYVEKHIRSQFLLATNRRQAYGRWTCLCGDEQRFGFHPPQALCTRCQTGTDQYNELTLFDHENWIKGNPDLIAVIPDNWLVPVEVKSINKAEFEALTDPKGDHVFQLSHYWRMIGLAGLNVHTHGIVIYCTKDFKFGSPYKEFHVDMRQPHIQTMLEDSVQLARSLRRSREEGAIPPRTLCDSFNSTRAKNCPFVVSCFSR